MTLSNIHKTNTQSSQREVVFGIGGIEDSGTATPLPPTICPPFGSGQNRAVGFERKENSQQPAALDLLAQVRAFGRVSKDLKEAIAANPEAASFGLSELNEAVSNGVEIKNKMGYFRSQMNLVATPKPKSARKGASNSSNAQPVESHPNGIPKVIKPADIKKYATPLDLSTCQLEEEQELLILKHSENDHGIERVLVSLAYFVGIQDDDGVDYLLFVDDKKHFNNPEKMKVRSSPVLNSAESDQVFALPKVSAI